MPQVYTSQPLRREHNPDDFAGPPSRRIDIRRVVLDKSEMRIATHREVGYGQKGSGLRCVSRVGLRELSNLYGLE